MAGEGILMWALWTAIIVLLLWPAECEGEGRRYD